MLSEKERNSLITELNKVKSEIKELRSNLNKINDEKEKAFSEKEEIRKKISELIALVKETKGERNKFTKDVRGAKKERDRLNRDIAKKINDIKKFNKKKKELESKFKITVNPSSIKRQIDALEQKIETEVMEFSKEKAIMKKVNELKKQYKEVRGISDIWEESSKLSKDIDKLKAKADSLHKIVKDHAKESQEKHEEVVGSSDEINNLREKEEDAYKIFFGLKQKYGEINILLKQKLEQLGKIHEDLGESKAQERQKKEKRSAASLKDRKKAVEEKLKKGGKITTEDFMIMQADN